nr:MAG TPA: Protein of unknown function (DUF1642) [Caudoviricetes sp.]
MNKQELIEKIKKLPFVLLSERYISQNYVLELLKQLDEPQKVKIPQVVADVIEGAREESSELEDAFEYARDVAFRGEIGEWFMKLQNRNIFARAWLDGYEVEKEKRYRVKVKGIEKDRSYLAFGITLGIWFFTSAKSTGVIVRHTRKQLEDAGFGEVFNSTLFEVEEVE